MGKRKCTHGFHGSLHEDLSNDLCPECGRNYSNESFLKACKGLGIKPEDVVGERMAKKIKDNIPKKGKNNGKTIS